MPKGQKIVDWAKPENSEKLLYAIIASSDFQLNYAKVAELFGDGVPASCISTKIYTLRKQAQEKGIVPAVSVPNAKGTTKSRKKGAKGAKSEVQADSDASETGVDVKMEGKLSDEEKIKPAVKKMGKGSKKSGDDKIITGRVTKPRAKASAPNKKAAKAKNSTEHTDDNKDHDGDATAGKQGMTPEESSENEDADASVQALGADAETEMAEA
ncbi:MAG: hypothetical protein Q9218_007425 [Villophora microphyllina]